MTENFHLVISVDFEIRNSYSQRGTESRSARLLRVRALCWSRAQQSQRGCVWRALPSLSYAWLPCANADRHNPVVRVLFTWLAEVFLPRHFRKEGRDDGHRGTIAREPVPILAIRQTPSPPKRRPESSRDVPKIPTSHG